MKIIILVAFDKKFTSLLLFKKKKKRKKEKKERKKERKKENKNQKE